ncbi:Stomatinlike protein 1like, partial [Caligus rogercresseyi]
DKRIPAGEIQDEVNDQVRKWGIDIQAVSLSEPKILKAPDNGSTSAMGSILKGLGMKGESKYPTPEEFVRTSHGLETPENDPMMLGGGIPAPASMMMPQAHQQVASSGAPSLSNMGMLQMLSSGAMPSGVNQVQLGPGIVQPENNVSGMSISCVGPDKGNGDIASVCNWGKCLDIILQKEFSGPLEEDACGLYELEITETECGKDKYWIEIQQTSKVVRTSNEEGRTPDVSVSVSSPDLSSILEGTLAPLQAYLTGRISASGDVRKLMLFDKLSKRGHKPGTMFNI